MEGKVTTSGGALLGDPGRPALTPQKAWGDLALSGRCAPPPECTGDSSPAPSLCHSAGLDAQGTWWLPPGQAGADPPPRTSATPPSACLCASDGSGPIAGTTWVSQTQESWTRDTVLSVLSGGHTPDAAPARGAPTPDASPRGPHFCPEARTFPSSMLCSWSL